MEIKLPEIIDAHKQIIKTSDGFIVNLKDTNRLCTFYKDEVSGDISTDIFVYNISILRCNDGTTKIVAPQVPYGYDDRGAAINIYDLTGGVYIFKHSRNMFKFGYLNGETRWKDDGAEPWIMPEME
jgi:hypothetical protein